MKKTYLDAWEAYKTKRFIKKHRTTVMGEIVGREYEGRYTVGECTYRIAANDYKLDEPVIGQKVYVHYNPNDPTQMRVGALV